MTDETELCVSHLHGLFIMPVIVLIIGIIILIFSYVIPRSPIISFILPFLMILVVAVIIIGVFLLIRAVIKAFTDTLIITSKRIIIQKGFFCKKEQDIRLDCVDGINVDLPFFLRMSGAGKIKIYSVGQRKLKFGPVSNPKNIRNVIMKALDAQRQQ